MKKLNLLLSILLFAVVCTAQQQASTPAKPTDIVFEKTVHDFGDIPYKSDAKVTYTFKNISSKPIALTNVRASCGCTTPEWSKEPIAKKKKGKIVVSYDTNRIGSFNKTISVFTDRQEHPIQLQVKGNVLPPAEGSEHYDEYKSNQLIKQENKKQYEKKKVEEKDKEKLEKVPNK